MGKEIQFRPATFYLSIADMLAREVEGQDELDPLEDGEIQKPKVGPGVELEEHPSEPLTEQEETASPCFSEPILTERT